MNIVQMDGYAGNPGDISLQPWHEIPDADGTMCHFTVYDRTPEHLVIERAKDADIVITNKVVFSDEVMAQLPRLKYIGVLATGYNVVDIPAARKRGVVVTNIPAYSTPSVAQMAIAHLLHIANNVAGHSAAVHDGVWGTCPDFTFTLTPQLEMAERVFGVVGLGNTGLATAAIAHALGMQVVAYTSKDADDLPSFVRKAESMEALFSEADVLSLHCPLTDVTHHLINAERLAMMKPTAIIINTGRGPLIDEQALADALHAGTIYAAGIDVLQTEPPVDGSPLLTAPRCHITPHIAWASVAARQRLINTAIDNIKAFIAGKPQNVVS